MPGRHGSEPLTGSECKLALDGERRRGVTDVNVSGGKDRHRLFLLGLARWLWQPLVEIIIIILVIIIRMMFFSPPSVCCEVDVALRQGCESQVSECCFVDSLRMDVNEGKDTGSNLLRWMYRRSAEVPLSRGIENRFPVEGVMPAHSSTVLPLSSTSLITLLL